MQVKSHSRNLRISSSKVEPVASLIRKKNVSDATKTLKFTRKKAASFLLQAVNSAVANATNNYGLEEDNLYIRNILIGQGPTFKRWRARARGSADEILKRTTHISVILDEKVLTSERKVKERVLAKKRRDQKVAKKRSEKEKKKEPQKKPTQDLRQLSRKASEETLEDKERLSSLQEKKEKGKGQKKRRGFLSKFFRRKAE